MGSDRTGPLHLDEFGLFADASERAGGLSDLGGDWARTRFRLLVRLVEMGAARDALSAAPKQVDAVEALIEMLVSRLRFVNDETVYSGIAEERIESPLVVIGMARSGTTLLHSLLAQDPANRAPRYWEVRRPSPPPGLAPPDDPRMALANHEIATLSTDFPRLRQAHPYYDQGGLTLAESSVFWNSEVFFGGFLSDDSHMRYAFHRSVLQHLQFGSPGRRWVFKHGLNQLGFDALMETYPDAIPVWIHRDPVKVVASVLQYNRIGPWVVRQHGPRDDAARRTVRTVRAALDDALCSPHFDRVHHVLYQRVMDDPIGAVGEVYERHGLRLTTEAERNIRSWMADASNSGDRYGRFRYSLDAFGLTADAIEECFCDYRERFMIPREA